MSNRPVCSKCSTTDGTERALPSGYYICDDCAEINPELAALRGAPGERWHVGMLDREDQSASSTGVDSWPGVRGANFIDTSEPAQPRHGDLRYDRTANKMLVFVGTAWVSI